MYIIKLHGEVETWRQIDFKLYILTFYISSLQNNVIMKCDIYCDTVVDLFCVLFSYWTVFGLLFHSFIWPSIATFKWHRPKCVKIIVKLLPNLVNIFWNFMETYNKFYARTLCFLNIFFQSKMHAKCQD